MVRFASCLNQASPQLPAGQLKAFQTALQKSIARRLAWLLSSQVPGGVKLVNAKQAYMDIRCVVTICLSQTGLAYPTGPRM